MIFTGKGSLIPERLKQYLDPLFILGLSIILLAFFVLPYTSAHTAAKLTVTLNPDHTITLDPQNGKLFNELSADPESLLAPGVTVERRLAVRNQSGNEAAFDLRVVALDGEEFLTHLILRASDSSDETVLYQGPLAHTNFSLGNIKAKGEKLFTLSVIMHGNLGDEFQEQIGHADFVFTCRGAGNTAGRDDEDDNRPPPVNNIPEGLFVGRWPGHVPLLDVPVMFANPAAEFSIHPEQKRLAVARAAGLEPRVYIWNEKYGRWVALASYPQADGSVKAINDGGYTGWAMVFAVLQPRFIDLQPGDWYEPVLNRANGLALLEGHPADRANPGSLNRLAQPRATMTRAEFVAMVARVLGLVTAGEQKMYQVLQPLPQESLANILRQRYRDAAAIPSWAGRVTATALESGILDGVGGMETAFGPEEAISRIQAARIISNALMKTEDYEFKPADFSAFTDGDRVPPWASGTVAQGVLTGNADGSLAPDQPLTRAEAYTLLLRLLRELGW